MPTSNNTYTIDGFTFDCYDSHYFKSYLQKSDSWHTTVALHEATIKGIYPAHLKTHVQSAAYPTVPFWSLQSRSNMYCGIFNSSGDYFFSGSLDGVIRIFDSSQKFFKLTSEIFPPESYWSVVSLQLSPNERHLAYSILNSHIYLISLDGDPSSYQAVVLGDSPHTTSSVTKTFSVCYDGTSSRIYAGHDCGSLGIFDIETDKTTQFEISPSRMDVNAVTVVDPGGQLILAGGDDTSIRLLDSRCINQGAVALFVGHIDGITYLDAKVGGFYFLSNSKDQTVRLWDLRKHSKPGKERRTKLRSQSWDYRIHPVPKIYTTPRSTACGSRRGDQSVMALRGHTVRCTLIRARFSPAHSTGQRFAYAGSTTGGWCIWDLYTGQLVHRNSLGSRAIRDVHWHPWEPLVMSSEITGSITCWRHLPSDTLSEEETSPPYLSAREQLEKVDSDRQRYRTRLENSGLRYKFHDGHAGSPSNSDSSVYMRDPDESSSMTYSPEHDDDEEEQDYYQFLINYHLDQNSEEDDLYDSDWSADSSLFEESGEPPITRSGATRRPRRSQRSLPPSAPSSRRRGPRNSAR